jgi:hypothetical protein
MRLLIIEDDLANADYMAWGSQSDISRPSHNDPFQIVLEPILQARCRLKAIGATVGGAHPRCPAAMPRLWIAIFHCCLGIAQRSKIAVLPQISPLSSGFLRTRKAPETYTPRPTGAFSRAQLPSK